MLLGIAICTKVVINLRLHELNRIGGHELRDVCGGWLASSHVTTAHVARGTSALLCGSIASGRPAEPTGLFPTHPRRALGVSARGRDVGESVSCR